MVRRVGTRGNAARPCVLFLMLCRRQFTRHLVVRASAGSPGGDKTEGCSGGHPGVSDGVTESGESGLLRWEKSAGLPEGRGLLSGCHLTISRKTKWEQRATGIGWRALGKR